MKDHVRVSTLSSGGKQVTDSFEKAEPLNSHASIYLQMRILLMFQLQNLHTHLCLIHHFLLKVTAL